MINQDLMQLNKWGFVKKGLGSVLFLCKNIRLRRPMFTLFGTITDLSHSFRIKVRIILVIVSNYSSALISFICFSVKKSNDIRRITKLTKWQSVI